MSASQMLYCIREKTLSWASISRKLGYSVYAVYLWRDGRTPGKKAEMDIRTLYADLCLTQGDDF